MKEVVMADCIIAATAKTLDNEAPKSRTAKSNQKDRPVAVTHPSRKTPTQPSRSETWLQKQRNWKPDMDRLHWYTERKASAKHGVMGLKLKHRVITPWNTKGKKKPGTRTWLLYSQGTMATKKLVLLTDSQWSETWEKKRVNGHIPGKREPKHWR